MFRSGYLAGLYEGEKDTVSDVDYAEISPSAPRRDNTVHTVIDMRNIRPQAQKGGKRGKAKGITITICAILMCVSILLLSVDFFSAKGIVGELKTVLSLSKETAGTYYAVNMGSFNTLSEARQLSDGIRSRGAAGYITYNGKYNVLAACYVNYDDAKTIADGNGAAIYAIRVFPKNKKNFPSKLREEFENAAGYEKTVYDTLYLLSNRLDEGTLNESDCIASIAELKMRVKADTDRFIELSETYSDEYTQEFRVGIIACLAALDNLTNTSLIRPNLLCDIRYTYIMVLNLA